MKYKHCQAIKPDATALLLVLKTSSSDHKEIWPLPKEE